MTKNLIYITDKKEEAVISIKKTSNMGFHTEFWECQFSFCTVNYTMTFSFLTVLFLTVLQYFTVKLHE